ncbi:MAG: tRNA glutamyl-Q(34) synthetase GluQRS [Reinekea sp.]
MTCYRGRFAPTPTGLLHFGSLFAAVVSYLDARSVNGQWLVRIEDIDPPREQPGAASAILKTLESHGLYWDEEVNYQSQNTERYLENLAALASQDRLFWCHCSRKQLAGFSVYPGFCRQNKTPRHDSAARLRIITGSDSFVDKFQGLQTANLSSQYGDVVLQRRDQLFSYQLAVVSDDIASNITNVVRGIDLLGSTYWQRELYRAFDTPYVNYGHFPVLHSNHADQKLSKQNLAPAVDDTQAIDNLKTVFTLLGLEIDTDRIDLMLSQAIQLWQPDKLTGKDKILVDI